MAMMGIIFFVLLMIAVTYTMSWIVMSLIMALLFGKLPTVNNRLKNIIKK